MASFDEMKKSLTYNGYAVKLLEGNRVSFADPEPSPESLIAIGGTHYFDRSFGEKYISFLRRIEEDPQDSTTKLIMCDFLEESNQMELINAWREIIETKKIPDWYPECNEGWGWFFCSDITEDDPDHYTDLKYVYYISNLTADGGDVDCSHSFYKNDFVYAYHDYAQAIVKWNEAERKRIEEEKRKSEELLKKMKEQEKQMESWNYSDLRDYYDGN